MYLCCHFILAHLVGILVPVATHTVVHNCTRHTEQTELSHCPAQFINFPYPPVSAFQFCMASSQQCLSLRTPLLGEACKQSNVFCLTQCCSRAAVTGIKVNMIPPNIAPTDQREGARFKTANTESLTGFPSVNTATCVCWIHTTKPAVPRVGTEPELLQWWQVFCLSATCSLKDTFKALMWRTNIQQRKCCERKYPTPS